MPQIQLPMFPEGVTHVTSVLAFEKRDGRVTYFNGMMPVFSHDEHDVQTFRMITSQFCLNGNATQAEIAKAFGVPLSTIKRYCKLYREKGPGGFYAPKPHRGAAVLTEPVLRQAQELLDEKYPIGMVAQQLGIKRNTLTKAVRAGHLHVSAKKKT
jgi:transposase-like protein